MQMKQLNLPPASFRLRPRGAGGDKMEVYDPIRCRWVALTPEEHVRQLFTSWLVAERGYSPHRMANEMTITLNGMSRRCDTVVYDSGGRCPAAIIEYKAPSVRITAGVFAQAARYNTVLATPVLMVSNGLTHYCAVVTPGVAPRFLAGIPDYDTLMEIAGAAQSR